MRRFDTIKKIAILTLVLMLVLALAACGNTYTVVNYMFEEELIFKTRLSAPLNKQYIRVCEKKHLLKKERSMII